MMSHKEYGLSNEPQKYGGTTSSVKVKSSPAIMLCGSSVISTHTKQHTPLPEITTDMIEELDPIFFSLKI